MHRIFAILLLALCAAGCVIPLPSKTTADHQYTPEAIAFLDLPGTTREDVTSTLGPPMVETHDPVVFLYAWRRTSRFYFIPPPEPAGVAEALDLHPSLEHGGDHYWALFIAFDEHGLVSKHEIRQIGGADLEKACQRWALTNAAR